VHGIQLPKDKVQWRTRDYRRKEKAVRIFVYYSPWQIVQETLYENIEHQSHVFCAKRNGCIHKMAGGRRDMESVWVGGKAYWTRDLGTWYFVTMFHLSCRTQAAYRVMIPNKAQRREPLNSRAFSQVGLTQRQWNDLQNPSPVNMWAGKPVSYNPLTVSTWRNTFSCPWWQAYPLL
jgi:hypothetical protein